MEKRSQIDHWENDTLISKAYKQSIVTLVEPKSGYAVLKKLIKKTSQLVLSAMIKGLKQISGKVKTITFDNGWELFHYAGSNRRLKSTDYFADSLLS